MYLKRVQIQNTGPLQDLDLHFSFSPAGLPKPMVLIGQNGTGKSILLSYIVNALIGGKSLAYDDTDVAEGRVFKYRSPQYITSGKDYSYGSVSFSSGASVGEYQLKYTKDEFESKLGYTPIDPIWQKMSSSDSSIFKSTFDKFKDPTVQFYKQQCCVYFPVDRFEDPAWLNVENLRAPPRYSDVKKILRTSNRKIINTSPLRTNRDWLFDVVVDREIYERNIVNIPVGVGVPGTVLPAFLGYKGSSTNVIEAAEKILRTILRSTEVRFGVGGRKDRMLAVMCGSSAQVPNVFQLSTGEVQLLNLFLTILRDYDLSDGTLTTLADVKGIVVVDEVDAHLHVVHQREILPALIKAFPNVQFVLTTHSPLFLIGLQEQFAEEAFDVIELPTGRPVSVSEFSEFLDAYEAFKATKMYMDDVRKQIEDATRPLLYVEGDYDIKYLRRAAELLGRTDTLDKFELRDGGGYGNLDKIWRSLDSLIAGALHAKVVLLYDCDTRKVSADKGRAYKRVIPWCDNPIPVGIENLFGAGVVSRLERDNPTWIDVKLACTVRIRGELVSAPEARSVNKDEKLNLCNWLCEHGTSEDFEEFQRVFDLLEDTIASESAAS